MNKQPMSTTIYRTGCNQPGYLPNGEVYASLSWEAARGSLEDELERFADYVADSAQAWVEASEAREAYALLEEAEQALKELKETAPGEDFQVYLGGYVYWLEGSGPVDAEEARLAAAAEAAGCDLDDVVPYL